MGGPSNLPPGITESMIPGCGGVRFTYNVTPEDFVEITMDDWLEWDVEPGSSECFLCSEVVGFYIGRSARNPDVDTEAWATCWEVDEDRLVCDDCRERMLDDEERAQAKYEAAMARYETEGE